MEKKEAKSTVSTEQGFVDISVIIDICPEDIVEHMAKCALAELGNLQAYADMPDNSILTRRIKAMLVERKK